MKTSQRCWTRRSPMPTRSEETYRRTRLQSALRFAVLALSFVGYLDSLYLTIAHYLDFTPRCSVIRGCETVLTGRFSSFFGIPTSAFGMVFYLIVLLLGGGDDHKLGRPSLPDTEVRPPPSVCWRRRSCSWQKRWSQGLLPVLHHLGSRLRGDWSPASACGENAAATPRGSRPEPVDRP